MRARTMRRSAVACLAAYQLATWATEPLPVPEDVRTLLRMLAFAGTSVALFALLGDERGEQ